MQSDKDIGRKQIEEEELFDLLEAYKSVTGEQLDWGPMVSRSESPDFILSRSDGTVVGVELTQVEQEPQDSHDAIFHVLDKKQWDPDWKSKVILVIQLWDYPLDTIIYSLTEDIASDFADYGWLEVWLADYTCLEAYGCVDLFGLVPEKWWGYHQGPRHSQKPYG